MVFSSIVFLLYFLPIFLLCYFFVDKRYKNALLLIFSIFFYAWGAPKFIFVILGTTFIDFNLVSLMDRSKSDGWRKLLLVLSVSINLGLLFYFKYSGFFVENLNQVLTKLGFHEKYWPALILPIGISFYTFETITYVVDVYRRVHKPLEKFRDYMLYIILFPKLIAGPIVRYHELADQITNRTENETTDNRLTGFYRFILGLAKKVLIANSVGRLADEVFWQNPEDLDTMTAWIGSLAYTFQIYFDFSGYSDMAIGLAKMLGFRFPENFNNPYISQSVTDFWRRWHMTLGKWMKNYLYIPLGGNRVTHKWRLYVNLWLVFLLSGFWHGASWSFIFWGAFHGFFMVIERGYYGRFLRAIGKIPAMLLTFVIINVGWVFFRMPGIEQAFSFVGKMFSLSSHPLITFDGEFRFYFLLALFFSFFAAGKFTQKIQDAVYFDAYSNTRHILVFTVSIMLFLLSVGYITSTSFNPFIYFRF